MVVGDMKKRKNSDSVLRKKCDPGMMVIKKTSVLFTPKKKAKLYGQAT